MIYNATLIRHRYLDDFEGAFTLSVGGKIFVARHIAPVAFVRERLHENDTLPLDFRLTGGIALPCAEKKKEIPYSFLAEGKGYGVFYGEISEVFDSRDYRLDCGDLTFDVREPEDAERKVGDFVSLDAALQIYFPDTECSWEALAEKIHTPLPSWRL